MSGHSKWSTIKHRKGAQDARRGKLFTKLIKEITVAARQGGGDPGGNPRLRHALDAAKAANMPQDNITRAIKKGTGELEGVQYEELTYEGVGPSGTLVLIDVLTDNRNRSAPEIRKILERHGGQLSSAGAAAWAFDQKGIIVLPKEASSEEELMEHAAEAGAEDIEGSDDEWIVTTERQDLYQVRDTLEKAGLSVSNASLQQIAKTPKTVSPQDAETLITMLEALDDHDDVQNVHTDADLSS